MISPSKIAIINLGYIGDVINASALCSSVKQHNTDAEISFITIKPSVETAKCVPSVDNVLVYDRRGEHKGLLNLVKLANKYKRKYKFDLVIVLDNNLRSAFFAYNLGAKYRAGRTGECRSLLLTHKIPHLEEEKNMQIHVSEHYMRILKPLGWYSEDYVMELKASEEDNGFVEKLLADNNLNDEKLLGICPCARFEHKNWNPEETAKFIEKINNETDYKPVIIGDNGAKDFISKIRDIGVHNFIDLSGKTTIPQLVSLVSKFEKFISVDTGPMHMAFALGIPTLALFYFDIMKKWGPKDTKKHSFIYSEDRDGIKAEQVFEDFINL